VGVHRKLANSARIATIAGIWLVERAFNVAILPTMV